MKRKGFTLVEVLIVIVIMAVGAALAIPRVSQKFQNQNAKRALGTLSNIMHAVRLYEVNQGNLLDDQDAAIDIVDLQNAGYIVQREYTPGYAYSINTTAVPSVATAVATQGGRTITLTQHPVNKSQDGAVTDTGNFLTRSE